jgi:Zn-dependent peptidase ImmA (M78 family)
MLIENLPHYSASEIENKSKKLLLYFSPKYFDTIQATPLNSIVNFLRSNHKIVFQFDVSLGFNSDNNRILGACNPIKRVILIDSSLISDLHKFNFTLAHELGHLALHRKIKIKYGEQDENINTDTVAENMSKKELKTSSDWLEWQANTYASSLLMPTKIFTAALAIEQTSLGITRTGRIFLDDQPCNQRDYYQIINLLGVRFNVSRSAVEYRLSKLKLIQDLRKGSISLGDHLKNI